MKAIEMMTDDHRITMTRASGEWMPCLQGIGGWEYANLKPNTRYACCMVEMPEGYRLATEEDRKGEKPSSAKLLYLNHWENVPQGNHRWDPDSVYIVPIKDKNADAELLKAWADCCDAFDKLLRG